jgi:hypothetical protein
LNQEKEEGRLDALYNKFKKIARGFGMVKGAIIEQIYFN